MTTRKLLAHTLLATSLSILASTGWAQTLKLGHVTPPSHVWHQVAEDMGQKLSTATNGKMKIAVSPLSKLGTEAQMVNLMQSGAQHFGIMTAGALANREESFQGWALPYAFKDVAHAAKAANTPAAKEMLKRLETHGMVGLGYTFAGMRHVLAVEPVKSAKDLVNKKVRSFPSPIYNDWWRANGAAPTAMPLPEVAPSLTTKLLDAVDVDLDALVGMKFYQQAPYLTMTNHSAFPGVIVASKKWWESRSEEERAMLTKVIAEAQTAGVATAIQAEADNLAKAKADNTTVVEADLQSFMEVGAKVREQYTSKNPLIADFYQQSQGL